MKIGEIDIHADQLEAICRTFGVRELSIFGSALGASFGRASDIDVIVEFEPGTHPTLFTLDDVQAALEQVLRRPVDLLTKGSILRSRNIERRDAILRSAQVLYAA